MSFVQIPPDERAFLESMVVPCVIATLRPDGAPMASATWFALVDDSIIISTPAERNKARNVRRDARISFLVDTKERPYRGVAIEGIADVSPDPDGELLRTIIQRYLGHTGDEALRSRLEDRGDRVIVTIRPVRVRSWNI